MSDFGPYGVTQHVDAEAVTANELVGERAGNVTAHQADPQFSRATSSTAPYRGPRPGKCTGKDNTCEARPMKGTNVCWFHYQQKERRELTDAP